MAPRANVPAKITDLAALQRGPLIYAQFSAPTRTTEGVLIHTPLTFDLRAGPGLDPFNLNRWLAQAQRFEPASVSGGFVAYQIPAAAWTGKDILMSARAIGENGKDAGWSAIVTVSVLAPPAKPQNLDAEATAQGVRLTWSGPSGDFRVFRRSSGPAGVTRLADVTEESWTDTTSEFGKPYTYIVQRIVKTAGGKEAESDFVQTDITPKDTFPPAAPTGLRASVAPGSIEITWQENTEPDLAGYRLYRAIGSGPFERIAEISQIPSYSDYAVEAGKTYRYAVTAFDQSANESDRSEPVEVTMP